MNTLTIFLLIILGMIALYIMFRLISKAIFRSYFEERINVLKNIMKGEKKDE